VAAASTGPYASLHCAPDRRQHSSTEFFTGRMPFLCPTNSVKALKARYYYIIIIAINDNNFEGKPMNEII